MTNNNPYIARFAGEPSLVAPHMRDAFEAYLEQLAAADPAKSQEVMGDDFWPEPGSSMSRFRPYVVKNGVLQVPVKGVLLNDFPYQFDSFATGYAYIQKAMERGMADDAVRGIALIIDSPGGQVAGNFDLVDKMYGMRGEKPIHAFAAESAYSAAYSIASAADKITVSRTGGVGSIGVVTSHIDVSKMLKQEGYKITFIHAGKHKVDGNPYEPLPDDVKARIQERIDALYSVFVATVARNRGIDEEAVRATEALCFTASEALSNKLADAIGSLDDSLAAFAADLNTKQGGTIMSKDKDTAAVDQATVDAARNEGVTQGKAEGKAEGAQVERTRIKGIMALDAAKNRHAAALNIALESDMTVEQAESLLAKLPEDQKPAASKDVFDAAMTGTGNPDLGSAPAAKELTASEKILADYHASVGSEKKRA